MTPAIAPPAYQPPTASVSAVMVYVADSYDALVEEPMDYAPIAAGQIAGPDFEDEAWTDDDSGPMGF